MSTLYVTDLDGTLLEPDSTLAEASARQLADLSARGVLVTCATARTPATVAPLLAPARLKIPAIVMTGAASWTFGEDSPHMADTMPIDSVTARTIIAEFARTPITPFIYTLAPTEPAPDHDTIDICHSAPDHDTSRPIIDVYHSAPSLTRAEDFFVEPRRALKLKRFNFNRPLPDDATVMMFFAMGDQAVIEPLAERIRALTGCAVSVYPDTYLPGLYLIEVFAPGVSKARAVLALKKRLGADRLVVFGDNLNDLPMMAVADVAVAAPGAQPAVRSAANIILSPAPTSPVPVFIAADTHRDR